MMISGTCGYVAKTHDLGKYGGRLLYIFPE